jgi:hypothetical protein
MEKRDCPTASLLSTVSGLQAQMYADVAKWGNDILSAEKSSPTQLWGSIGRAGTIWNDAAQVAFDVYYGFNGYGVNASRVSGDILRLGNDLVSEAMQVVSQKMPTSKSLMLSNFTVDQDMLNCYKDVRSNVDCVLQNGYFANTPTPLAYEAELGFPPIQPQSTSIGTQGSPWNQGSFVDQNGIKYSGVMFSFSALSGPPQTPSIITDSLPAGFNDIQTKSDVNITGRMLTGK